MKLRHQRYVLICKRYNRVVVATYKTRKEAEEWAKRFECVCEEVIIKKKYNE